VDGWQNHQVRLQCPIYPLILIFRGLWPIRSPFSGNAVEAWICPIFQTMKADFETVQIQGNHSVRDCEHACGCQGHARLHQQTCFRGYGVLAAW
jgi:hypothetical protein